jgi:hypothetical protein
MDGAGPALEDPEGGSVQAQLLAGIFVILFLAFAVRHRSFRRKPAAAEPTQRAVPQAAVKPIFEPVIEPEPEKKLSDVELACLLGNTLPDDEDLRVPRSVAKFGQGEPVTEEVEVDYKSAVAGAVARYTTPKEAGEALLRSLEGQDSELALQLVLEASTTAVNYVAEDTNRTALLATAMEGHTKACQHLLERADFLAIGGTDNIGANALHLAAANDHVEICELLIASSRFTAGINAKTRNGQTALDFAIEFGEGTCADVLAAAGGQRASSGNLRDRRKMRGQMLSEDGGAAMSNMSALD